MNTQRSFDVDPQPSLFTADERDQLDDIAAQASANDHEAMAELMKWARS